MHRRFSSATLSRLAFPGEGNPNFPWEKSHWDSCKKKKKVVEGADDGLADRNSQRIPVANCPRMTPTLV